MSNEKKLEVLKDWLREHGYPFTENYNIKNHVADVFVTKPNVAVKIGDDDKFFQAVKHFASPFFIRDNESITFILAKMENCIKAGLEKRQEAIARKKAKEEAEKKAAEEAAVKKEAELLAAEKAKAEEERNAAEKPKRKRQRIVRAEKVV